MLRPILSASVRVHALLSYAPTNRLLAWLRRRDRLKFGIPFMLLGLAYWMATILLAAWIQSGAPAALNLLVLLTFWNSAKFITFDPYSLLALTVARTREAVARRRAVKRERQDVADKTPVPIAT
ncbi:sulfate permease [Microbacterium limosum]|uniref:Sulfate permease n=1 Tax=Microbacterium limosum TaxID=3079935 RepID=A0AAU0MHW2_9MICO|nr:sulfate permease [Microbacterium sp. Y20]WOQ69838.1 sulfate permease [Microbacterium sp. Y20]